tara:strand:+ start:333 stop:1616 length:1284 start_codon:yes stop_codon:yes gene_type:complete
MKQRLQQKQKFSLRVTNSLGNQIKLLSLSGFEISTKLNNLIDEYFDEKDKKVSYFRDEYLTDKYRNFIFQGNDFLTIFPEETESNLQKDLLEQLDISVSDDIQRLIGEYLIDSVESNGRLDPQIDYEDLKHMIKEDFDVLVTDKRIEETLHMIQNFEPVGCAYRNINESLKIQIENLDITVFEKEVLNKNLQAIKEEKINIEQVPEKERINLSKLSLNPAAKFGDTFQNYIRPDLLAIYENKNWHVSINDDFMSKELIDILKNKIDTTESEHKEDSKSFIKGLERRQQTLLLVSEYLIEAQSGYLLDSSEKRAISNKEVASKLNISQSTVSRIVRNKYLQLPGKVLLLKDLIEKRVNRYEDGADVTSNDLKFLIEELVKKEEKSNPFSDERLRDALKDQFKVNLSRRTVAKYRLDLNIPSSKMRRLN